MLPRPHADLPLEVTRWQGADGAARPAGARAIPPSGFALMFGEAWRARGRSLSSGDRTAGPIGAGGTSVWSAVW